MHETALHERMKTMVGQTTFRALGQATNHNPETVRRYMSGQAPSVEFLSALIVAYSVNADWLLTGRGPKDRSEVRSAALTEADPNELMAAIASRMENMCDRIDRIEIFTQTMETRLRSSVAPAGRNGHGAGPVAGRVAEVKIAQGEQPPCTNGHGVSKNDIQDRMEDKGLPSHETHRPKQTTDDPAADRADAVADALTRRPHPDTR